MKGKYFNTNSLLSIKTKNERSLKYKSKWKTENAEKNSQVLVKSPIQPSKFQGKMCCVDS